jgi:molybdenum cofactor cytidylyltransferase
MRNVGAVILAAGGSSRLGQPKQLLQFRGETLIRRAVRAAEEAGCDPIIVVTGELSEAIRRELLATRARIVENAEWHRGLGTSIRRGIETIPESNDAVILLTCDQPMVDRSVVMRLITAWEETGKPIVASSYANTVGVPALFDRSLFDALLQLPAAAGAKTLMLARPDDVGSIAFAAGAVDVDMPQDFERLKQNCD